MSFAEVSFHPQLSAAGAAPAGGALAAGLSGAREAWPVAILGVPFSNLTLEGAVDRIDAMMESRAPHYVVTANVDFLIQARRDVELRRILIDADLVLCDGTPLVWASRWLGNALPERAAGSDLVPRLLDVAERKGRRVFLLGGAADVADEAAARLQAQYPKLALAGHYSPPYRDLLEMDHEEIARRIRAARPDLLLVSFGCPKQEKWIAMHYRSLGVPVVIGVGGTIDFLAGRLKRAPLWMRRSGLEWCYRLRQEPRRLFRRYGEDLIHFLPALVAQWWRVPPLSGPAVPGEHKTSFTTQHWLRIWVGHRFTAGSLQGEAEFWRDAMHYRRHCLLDLSSVRAIDSTGAALLVRWRKQLRAAGRELVLLYPSPAVRRALRELRLEELFLVAESLAQAQQQVSEAMGYGPPTVLNEGLARPLVWQGEITAANAEGAWLVTALHLITRGKAAGTVPIDLSRLRFMDSSGAGLMIRVAALARQFDTDVRFTGAQPNVRNVLRLSQTERRLAQPALG